MNMPALFPVTAHTDFVGSGTTFVAIQGFAKNGLDYIPLALARGACHIVVAESAEVSNDLVTLVASHNATLERVPDTRKALATLSAQMAGFPACQLKIIAITGTKGKTTTSFIVHHMLNYAGHKTALMTTVHNSIGSQIFSAPLTTAQPDYLHQFLKLCVESGMEYVVMETAAQAFSMNRLDGLSFHGAIFTNFSQEHLEFYPNMQGYFDHKLRILDHLASEAPIIVNSDNEWLARITGLSVRRISIKDRQADWCADDARLFPALDCKLIYKAHEYRFTCPALVGEFNVYNIMAAAALVSELGIEWSDTARALQTFIGVPGRVQKFELPNGAQAIIDYAHNPLSFENIFKLLRGMTDNLIVVFGAGGDRDKTRRPMMGALAEKWADSIFITTDNPRSEDAVTIAQEIQAGMSQDGLGKTAIELDRAVAIRRAYEHSRAGSIVALLGKGPDEYQIFGHQKIFFSEAQILQSLR